MQILKNIIDINLVMTEYRNLPFCFGEEEKEKLKTLSVVDFWLTIIDTKIFCDEFVCKNISNLALIKITLPHSNPEAERIFSIVNDVKTKKRNKIGQDSLNAVCMIRSKFSDDNTNCTNFLITDKHINYFNNKIYKKN